MRWTLDQSVSRIKSENQQNVIHISVSQIAVALIDSGYCQENDTEDLQRRMMKFDDLTISREFAHIFR